jgi:dipeptidyl aminopeptidase/acylaminoacyl peptidase
MLCSGFTVRTPLPQERLAATPRAAQLATSTAPLAPSSRLSMHLVTRSVARNVARLFGIVALLTPAADLAAQQPTFDLSVKNIMRGPELYGREPEQLRWSADGQWLYFRWLEPGAAWNAPLKSYRVAARAGATPEAVTEAHVDSVAPMLATGPRSPDGRLRVVAANGDLWVQQGSGTGLTLRRLTQTNANESDPRFSLDARDVYFVREGNAYAFTLANGLIRQLTDIRAGVAPKDSAAATGQRGALQKEQRDLLQVIRDRLAADSMAKALKKDADSRKLPVVWIPTADRVVNVSVSPDGKSAMITTSTTATASRNSDVPEYVTVDGYPRFIPSRNKVGDAQNTTKIGHLDLATGTLTWLDLTTDKKGVAQARVGDWSDDGRFVLISATTADFKTRTIFAVASSGAKLSTVDVLRDEAWVNGPCFGCTGWTPDGRVWFVSEATGYAHLYSAMPDGSAKTALTSGAFEVLAVDRSDDGKSFWLTTSEGSPFTRQGWKMPIAAGARTKFTTGTGGHTPLIGPDGATYATVYSESNLPPELYVGRVGANSQSRLTTSTSAEFRSYAWIAPEIVMIPGEDGTPVPARIYTPAQFGAKSNGAAVIFVHGAGYLHNIHNYWSSYSREYMFNHLLAAKGYTVLDIDYRGSAGYGRDWRTAIYRWMGGKDLDDHVSGSKYLTSKFGIAPERIGLYGGSYGGFITLMALFTKPQYFGAGAALRPVTDWANYNHGYTGRILNLPQDDTTAYRRSSPIFSADGLQDPLLIAHGMIDTNVHFLDSVELAQRLIELGKEGWELAAYPVEDHGFVRPSSWTDEYRRILSLFERTIGPKGSKSGN